MHQHYSSHLVGAKVVYSYWLLIKAPPSHSQQTNRLLDEEERDDTGLRDNFKEKWTRTPSNELNKPFREEVTKYQGILSQAGQADATVKEKYASCRKAVEILSKSEEELAQMIPKGGHSAARSGSQVSKFIKGRWCFYTS